MNEQGLHDFQKREIDDEKLYNLTNKKLRSIHKEEGIQDNILDQ